MSLENLCFIDGRDVWNIYGVVYEKGGDDFLKFPAAKDRISHDWTDSNGTDVDTSLVTFKSREITLFFSMWIQDGNADTFMENHSAFIALMGKPGQRRIELTDLGLRSFFCIYKETPTATRHTGVYQNPNYPGIFFSFSVKFTELEPNVSDSDEFIVDEDGAFLIT